MPFVIHTRSLAPDLLRGLLTAMVALALAGAPSFAAMGGGQSVRDLAEAGAAGVLPFAADPGHRMSPGTTAPSSAPASVHAVPRRWSLSLGPVSTVGAAAREGVVHAWLRLLLIGARLQTDGG